MRFTRAARQEEEPEFQMAPMIDIIFQLLIFFMVISTFQKLEDVAEVKLPVADKSQTKKASFGEVVINVMEDGSVVLNQRIYELDELLAVLTEQTGSFKMTKVTIRGDRDVPHAWVAGVMKVCQAANIWDVSFATFQEEPR